MLIVSDDCRFIEKPLDAALLATIPATTSPRYPSVHSVIGFSVSANVTVPSTLTRFERSPSSRLRSTTRFVTILASSNQRPFILPMTYLKSKSDASSCRNVRAQPAPSQAFGSTTPRVPLGRRRSARCKTIGTRKSAFASFASASAELIMPVSPA